VQPEEAKRNSVMFNMLFVNGSHTLSPYIYSLNSKYGHLPDEERNGIKEKLDPSARLATLYQNHGFNR
jgi:5'-3' exoribonuclease 2